MSDDEFGEREGERPIPLPDAFDAGVFFIGRINTPWRSRQDCPKNSAESNAICTLTLDPRYSEGLKDLETASHVIVLYWMDRAPRNLVLQKPRHSDEARGVFALRSPARPNPIALSVAELVSVQGPKLAVRGLDCIDGTPLLDLKPYFASTDAKPMATVGWHAPGQQDGA
jgi:tRNA-Thr(GGU) m(6)t(6)A37 methyltransferase TsaA